MTKIDYPYMPEGRSLKYVAHDFPFMKEAKRAQEELAGDPSYPVGAVLVKDGKILERAGNGFSIGKQIHVCPRLVLECPTGTGYDLCDLHDPDGHSEQMLMKKCHEKGIDPKGGDVYMYGHWWACEPCWNVMIENGINNVFVSDDAHERFTRDKVYAANLQPSVKNIYIAGALTKVPEPEKSAHLGFYEKIVASCEEMGVNAFVCHLHSEPFKHPEWPDKEVYEHDCARVWKHDAIIAEVTFPSLGTGGELVVAEQAKKPIILVSKKGHEVTRFVLGNPAVVYHVQYEDYEDACRQIKNVLKQL